MKKLLSIIFACTMMTGALVGCSCGDDSATQATQATEKSIESLYMENGFTDEDRRTEIKLDTSKGLNTKKVKNYIYDRMLNTYDYFDTLQATFYCVPSNGNAYYSAYCIQQGEEPRSKEVTLNANGEVTGGYLFDGKTATGVMGEADYIQTKANVPLKEKYCDKAIKERKDTKVSETPEEFIYEKTEIDLDKLMNQDFTKLVKSNNRVKFSHVANRNKNYYRESTALLSMSSAQYAPQSMTIGLLSQFNKWKIVGEEELFMRPCYVIEGKISGEYAGQVNIKKFEIKVDVETGILLSVKGFDRSGKQTYQLSTYEFEINNEIDRLIFK